MPQVYAIPALLLIGWRGEPGPLKYVASVAGVTTANCPRQVRKMSLNTCCREWGAHETTWMELLGSVGRIGQELSKVAGRDG